jgi:hypothetical protein
MLKTMQTGKNYKNFNPKIEIPVSIIIDTSKNSVLPVSHYKKQ